VARSGKHYRWTWDFRSPPGVLWPLVSDTNRFNRDCGFPPFHARPPRPGEPAAAPGVRRLRSSYLGIVAEWEERQFEWVEPVGFSVERVFTRGPLARMVQSCELSARPGGGTAMVYELQVTPRTLLGAAIVPLAIGIRMRRTAERVLRRYDLLAPRGPAAPIQAGPVAAAVAGRRLSSISSRLVSDARQPPGLVERLRAHVSTADELAASRMRPYALADAWGTGRAETLDLFLHATRAGMLDFSWDILCPHCRGSGPGRQSLSAVASDSHCDSCGVDFTANFDQSVELTFVPNPSVRRVTRLEYCVGGPRVTPHIVAQKRLGPMENLHLAVSFPEGRYRVRFEGAALQHAFRVGAGGASSARIESGPGPASPEEPTLAPGAVLNVLNAGAAPCLAVVERVAWSDQSVTAAAVTSRQIFRDLFSREILRQGEQISVGAITIVFTDLKNSTRLYREIGDAPAFGRVLNHFDTIKAATAREGGTVVKTMGDAVMAAFIHPAAGLRAMRRVQAELSAPAQARLPLALKCSIHLGPCLAITQNERMDYFGTTVNVGARLCALSTGADIVVSPEVLRDPEVGALLAEPGAGLAARPDAATLRGAGDSAYAFFRIGR
jgi:class 3 adenylate cyclase